MTEGSGGETDQSAANDGQDNPGKRKVAKTKLEIPVTDAIREAATMPDNPVSTAPEMPPPPPPPVPEYRPQQPELPDEPKTPKRRVSKTKLDHSVMQDQVLKSVAKMEEKVAEQIKEKAAEPGKPFVGIDQFKIASPCGAKWEGHDSKQVFKYCEGCQLPVYDFKGVELSDAEQIVFKRENREKPTFYRREDGKFLTQDCPVACKRRREKKVLIASVAVIALAAIAWMFLAPPPPPPPPAPTVVQEQTTTSDDTENSDEEENATKSPAKADTPGASSPIFSESDKQQSVNPTQQQPEAETETNDQFWQYSDGQPVAPSSK